MNKNLHKMTHLTLATTMTTLPIASPLVVQANIETDSLLITETSTPTDLTPFVIQEVDESSSELEDLSIEETFILESEEVVDQDAAINLTAEDTSAATEDELTITLTESILPETKSDNPTEDELEFSTEDKTAKMTLNPSFSLSDWEHTETTNEIVLTQYIGPETSLYIPGEHNGKQIVLPDLSLFPDSMTELTIEEVNGKKVKLQTNSLYRAFHNKTNIIRLDLNGLDTSNVTNMNGVFEGMQQLITLDIDGWDTSNVTDMTRMFYHVSQLKTLDVSNFNTSKVTSMTAMFEGMSHLTSLDVSRFDTSNVKNMGWMFGGLKTLSELNVNNFDTSNVTYMANMFNNMNSLTTLDVSGFDTSKVTSMAYMFNGMKNLRKLDVSNFDTSKVTNMAYMFNGMKNLSELDVSNFDTSNVTNMEWMFAELNRLTTLDVSNFNTSNVTDMRFMFDQMFQLEEVDVSNFNTSKVTNMAHMFYQLQSLKKLDVSNFNTSNVTSMEGMFEGLKHVTVLDVSGFNTSNVTYMGHMFNGMSSLTELDVSGFNTSNVTNMSSMFRGVSSITKLDVSNFDTSNVTDMSWMFNGLNQIKELDVSGFDTSNVTNMNAMFCGMLNLSKLDLSNWDLSNVENTTEMFKTDTQKPLLIISTDEKIKNYNFESDNRVGLQMSFTTNGGSFADGTTTAQSEPFLVIDSLEESYLNHLIDSTFQTIEAPTKDGYRFNKWQLTSDLNEISPLEQAFKRLSGTYEATWAKPISTINQAPVIHATDLTLTVGDSFDPFAFITATDPEDGELILNETNVLLNTVNSLKIGTYEVLYQVTDSMGATVRKLITVIVNPKPMVELPTLSFEAGLITDLIELIYLVDESASLNELKIISSDYDGTKAGTYTIVYELIDENGISTLKTLIITITPSETVETPAPEAPTPEVPPMDEDLPEIELPNELPEVDLAPENPSIEDSSPENQESEEIETGLSNGLFALIGGLSLISGILRFNKSKENN